MKFNLRSLQWVDLRKVIFVYERLNKETLGWEFAEPIMPQELTENHHRNTTNWK